MENSLAVKKGFSRTPLKYFAAVCMLADHIGWYFVPYGSICFYALHVFGRLTAPIMVFFLVEGFHHTSDRKNYLARLGIFSVISWFPYYLMCHGLVTAESAGKFLLSHSMMYTLFLTFLILCVRHEEKIPAWGKMLLSLLLFVLSLVGDWLAMPLIWGLIFDRFRSDRKKLLFVYAVTSFIMVYSVFGFAAENLFQYSVIFAVIPISLYNGERGKLFGNADKWFFYVFYPLHMLLLGIIRQTL